MAATRWGFVPAAAPALAGIFFAAITFLAALLPCLAGFRAFFLADFFLVAMATSFDSASSSSLTIPALPLTGGKLCRGGSGHSSQARAILQTSFRAQESKTQDH